MPDGGYQNFDLTIQKEGRGYRVRVESPAGQASGRFSVPFSVLELENFILTTTPGRRSVRRIDTPEVAAAKKFGERLFNSIFTSEVSGRFHSASNDAYRSDDRLRVRLRLAHVPELADLPWEYLYNPSLNRFLALDDDTALVRYLELPERVRPVTVALPLRVLVAISNPNDYPRLDVEQEWESLNEALSGLLKGGMLNLDLLEDATLPELRRHLSKGQYHVFHFIGHGGFDRQTEEGVLVLKDEYGRGRQVSGQQLGWLLRNHKTLALAVLNACEGARADKTDVFAGTAQSLMQQGIPAVVAMQREITDDAARTFAHAFYSAVADGRPVEAAMTETRLAIFAEGFGLEWATPVLYMRAPDGRVFDLSAPVVRSAPPVVEPPPAEKLAEEPWAQEQPEPVVAEEPWAQEQPEEEIAAHGSEAISTEIAPALEAGISTRSAPEAIDSAVEQDLGNTMTLVTAGTEKATAGEAATKKMLSTVTEQRDATRATRGVTKVGARKGMWLWVALAGLVAIALAALLLPGTLGLPSTSNSPSAAQTQAARRPADGMGTAVPDEGRAHVGEGQAISYKTYPPVSGTHYGSTAAYVFSDVAVPEGKLVHSLEHGAIVIYYKPEVGDAVKQQLKDLYTKLPAGKFGGVKLAIAPYSNMSTPLALAAWDRLFLLNEFNFDEIQTFYKTWVDKGPEDVP